jgi:hypothetical protein
MVDGRRVGLGSVVAALLAGGAIAVGYAANDPAGQRPAPAAAAASSERGAWITVVAADTDSDSKGAGTLRALHHARAQDPALCPAIIEPPRRVRPDAGAHVAPPQLAKPGGGGPAGGQPIAVQSSACIKKHHDA